MHKIAKNTNNLISLWETVGKNLNGLHQLDSLSYCMIENSDWPNRIWFTKEMTINSLKASIDIINNEKSSIIVSYWSDFGNAHHSLFEQFGFTAKSRQIGMSLQLHKKVKHDNIINLKRVEQEKEQALWSMIYPYSFGYKISSQIVAQTKDFVFYYLIYLDSQVIGTVITHQTEDTIGIHGLGILPEFRRKGYAEEVMKIISNEAIDREIKILVLQSSEMGKNIYKGLGFCEDFLVTNYTLNPDYNALHTTNL